ncbi:glucoamylase family protein [Flavobacterium restrictum]|uniref:Beta-glucosidase n=1 Tax=Flavobacterium restrictum TaxID=2594428 RepID=A0A553ECZ5_9FLAO|nr:glucoamylase family protein [Flavobacterium restrictum]TRX42907.1 beta-glucosidase [Flavobacterium restrictum]
MIKLSIVLLITSFLGCDSASNSGNGMVVTPPVAKITDAELVALVQKQTFAYFWEFAQSNSGMARERYLPADPTFDQNIVTTGGSGFGLMALVSGMSRDYITKAQGLERLNKIAGFLEKADRFHGAWSHWIDGPTGKVIPFGTKDNGGDLVETSFLAAGMLTVREYLKNGSTDEKSVAQRFDILWKGIDWNWYTNNQNKLYWHWSPDYNWQMNFPLEGYNETLITYVMAAASPTHAILPTVYHQCWARNGGIVSGNTKYNLPLILKHNGAEEFGGPLFWAHYSYLGLDPTQLSDMYANYWDLNTNQTKINYLYAVANPKGFKGYDANYWGLTASYSRNPDGTTGYDAHMPSNDKGIISPTAAISSIVYTPTESIALMRNLYSNYKNQVWGVAGFYDAHSLEFQWTAPNYLAIDQGPEVVMLENYRSGLIWKLFMNAPEVQQGLIALGFHSGKYNF